VTRKSTACGTDLLERKDTDDASDANSPPRENLFDLETRSDSLIYASLRKQRRWLRRRIYEQNKQERMFARLSTFERFIQNLEDTDSSESSATMKQLLQATYLL